MNILRRNTVRAFTRFYCEGPQASSTSDSKVPDVPGLSTAVVRPASGPVGPNIQPNKEGAYKVPEYFCYDNMSFFEAEIEMSKFRLPQPSALA